MILPFVQTPSRIVIYGLERTPIAPLLPHVRNALSGGGREAAEAASRMALGSTLMLAVSGLAVGGQVTGSAEVLRLRQRDQSPLTVCDDVMLVRPQSTAQFPTAVDTPGAGGTVEPAPTVDTPPIAALFDGVPVLGHRLLDGRVAFDDPDDLDALSIVTERRHGTEIASLILHADRNRDEPPLQRPLYVRPVLYAPGGGATERTQENRLLIDTIYRAVLRMKQGDPEGPATAPEAFSSTSRSGTRNARSPDR